FRRDDDDGETTSAEARNVLSSLQRVAGRRSVQSILSPYSFPDLPTLFRPVLHQTSPIAAEHLKQHLREAEVVLAQTVGKAPTRRWIYTPDGRLNHVSLEQLQQLDAARFALFAEESLEGLDDPTGGGCPEAPLSFTCAITVSTSSGRSTGYVLDSGIQDRIEELAGPDGGRSALQRLFAETAMIREEVPSRTDRIVAIGLPPLWQPRPRLTKLLFSGLRDAPWLRTFTPRQGLARLAEQVEPSERRIRFVVPRLVNEPPDDYFEQIVEAHEIIEAFRTVQPPQSLLQRLTRTTLVGESRLWWTDPVLLLQGERYAAEAADAGQRELDKITVGGSDEITLTSRRAEIPVEVFNDANYDVSVTVRIRSSDLRLDETFARTVQAQGLHQLSVDVAAPSSGIFTVFVTVETPNGRRIDGKEVQVRSTEFNEIALGLTFGALAFLVLFYITRAIRNRRGPEAETTP
ncbi:MAG: hypothetical protein KY391_00960, partial [Actinobacteria bacterium]|nr:hypothetical protein [Actinomycetota bacterium]